jgi:uncharacterized protein (DUF362 family)
MKQVAIYKASSASYLDTPPFHPGERYEEYAFDVLSDVPNTAYQAVRESLMLLGLDGGRAGTAGWNPLSALIRPGDTVVIKPNLVRHFHDKGDSIEAMVTHGSVVRAVSDFALKALGGEGTLILCDAPQDDGDFEALCEITGLKEVAGFYRQQGMDVRLLDLRPEMVIKKNGVPVERRKLASDPKGYVVCRLNTLSAFIDGPREGVRYRGSEYDDLETWIHHHDDVHEYLLSGTVLNADVVINVPKLKTHKKAGVSVCMKNLVGINGNKNWLPHHREGTPGHGGDQYDSSGPKQRLEYFLLRNFKTVMPKLGAPGMRLASLMKRMGAAVFGETDAGVVRSGNWYGNDTVWRMVIDLNRILQYAAPDGTITRDRQRSTFNIVDGIVGGAGNCPFSPEPHESAVVIAGHNPVAVDSVASKLMGFDYRAIPQILKAFLPHELPLVEFEHGDITCVSNIPEWDGTLEAVNGPCFDYKPHFGWAGHIESKPEIRKAD